MLEEEVLVGKILSYLIILQLSSCSIITSAGVFGNASNLLEVSGKIEDTYLMSKITTKISAEPSNITNINVVNNGEVLLTGNIESQEEN